MSGSAVFSRADVQKRVLASIRGLGAWKCVFEINWVWAVFYAFFLAYGYYGALALGFLQFKAEFLQSAGQLILLVGVQIVLGWVAWKNSLNFKDSVTVRARDLLVYISLSLLLLIFSYDRLHISLFSDELSYSGSAHGHSIYLAMAAARYFNCFDEYVFKYLVQAASLLIFAAIAVLFYVSRRWSPRKRIVVFVLLLVLGRLVFAFKGGNGSPHPPLHLIPPFVLGAFMGVSDVSFKLSYYLAYIGFLTILCKMMARVFSLPIAYTATLTIGTIPLLLNLSSVVEHSFWSFICFSLVFTEIVTSSRLFYFRLIGFVSIVTMMRQPSFLALLPIFFLYAVDAYREGGIKQRFMGAIQYLLLPLLFLPFLVSSLLHGTPSTNPWETGSNFDRVLQAVGNGIVFDSVSRALPLWWLAFVLFSFLPFQRKSWSIHVALMMFFVSAIYVYYSIHPSLWGVTKYQAEYVGPLVIVGFIMLLKAVLEHNKHQFILLPCLIILLVSNVMKLTDQSYWGNVQSSFSKAGIGKNGNEFDLLWLGLTAIPYEYKMAYAYIKQIGLSEYTYSIGATYGVLPEIMNGYTTRAVMASYDIYSALQANRLKNEASGVNVGMIESDSRIKAVIVGSIEKKQELTAELNDRGWRKTADFMNVQYGTSVVILKRP